MTATSPPSVFCAVMAVMADAPKTPNAVNVFRSAWMPAPPPESLPAIVSATFIQLEFSPMNAHASAETLLDRSLAGLELRTPARAVAVMMAAVLTAAAAQFTLPLPFTNRAPSCSRRSSLC